MATVGESKIGILKIGMAVGLGGLIKGTNQATGILSSFGSRVGSFGSSAVRAFGSIGLAVQGVKTVMAGLTTPLKLVSDTEQASAAFEVLTGSSQKAQAMIDSINKMAANSSVGGAPNIQHAAKTMLGFGLATEKVMPSLKAIGEITAGSAERFESLSLAFAQSSSAGRLMGQDLLQMINAGFNPLQQISKDTGKSIADLKKDMENGQISFAMVEGAFQRATQAGGLFNGMNAKIANTMGGLWNQLTAKVTLAVTKISQRIFELINIKGLIQWASSMVDVVIPKIEYFVSLAVSSFGAIRGYIQPVLEWLGRRWQFTVQTVSTVAGKLSPLFTTVFGLVGKAVMSLVPVWEQFQQVAGAALVFASEVLISLGNVVATVFNFVANWIGTNIVTWDTFKGFIVDTLNVIEFSLLNWKTVLAYVGSELALFAVAGVNNFVWLGQSAWTVLTGSFGIVKDYLVGWSKYVGNVIGNLVGNIINLFKNIGPLIKGQMSLGDIWTPLTEGFQMEVRKMPEIQGRVMTELEQQMNQTSLALASELGTGYDKFLADKKKNEKAFELPKLPTMDTKLNLDTTEAIAKLDGLKLPEKTGEIKLASVAVAGSKEARDSIIRHQMRGVDRSKDTAKDTAKNTKETAVGIKTTNTLLQKQLSGQTTTVSFV